jgi:hypothetical protein
MDTVVRSAAGAWGAERTEVARQEVARTRANSREKRSDVAAVVGMEGNSASELSST